MSGSDPQPPADIDSRRPGFSWPKAGTVLHRFHARARDPIFFDRSRCGRLNAPDGGYGVLYAAKHRRGAFAETFLRTPGSVLLPYDLISKKSYVAIELTEKLQIVRLFGPGLATIGCTAQVTHGPLPYDLPQAWSRALHGHPSRPDGIAYRARHDDNQIAYAIFDHARSKLVITHREPDLDQDWFYELADHYKVGVAAVP